jgi:hypothetical protein
MLLAGFSTLAASQTLSLDLATQAAGSNTTESIQPGSYAIRVDSRIPRLPYDVTVLVRTLEFSPLKIDTSAGSPAKVDSLCAKIDSVTDMLKAAYQGTSEQAVGTAVRLAEAAIATTAGCLGKKSLLENLVSQSQITWLRDVVIEAGQELVITVERKTGENNTVKTWRKTFTTGPRGHWRTTYGFAAAFTRMGAKSGVFAKRDSYFLKTVEDVTTSAARKDRGAADLVPAVLFHFMPSNREA